MSVYEFGPLQLDEARLLLLDRGVPLPIGPKVVETLLALIEHPGEVFPKNELLARIWPEGYVDEANLAQNIYVLRKTLRGRWNAAAIETIPRRGYRFTAAVRRREDIPRPEPVSAAPLPPLRRRWAVLAAACALALLGGSGLTPGATAVTNARSSVAAQDTRLYEIGRYYWNLRTRDGISKSVQYFRRIVVNDPADARGYAALASAYAIMADYGYGPAPAMADISRAQSFARKALTIDPASAEAYAVLGFIKAHGPKQSDLAVTYLRRAIALDPANGAAHEWYGTALLAEGRLGEAYAELSKAAQLEPLSVATTAWLGTAAYLQRNYRDALAYARETLDLSPGRSDAYETLGLAYEALGDQPRAAQSFGKLAQTCAKCRPEAAALLAGVYAQANQMARARAELTIAQAHAKDVSPEDLAAAFEAVGKHGAALTWMRKAQSDGYYATEIANDPRFAELRRSMASRQQKPA
jgi:DNA-binding winged helix-turn-helix (wHTH) protein/tetratricopeptide (TPR) repeat protein